MSHPDEFDPLTDGLFADVATIIAGGLEPERPTVSPVFNGGGCALYANRINELHGEPGTGKTNVALAMAVPSLALNKQVLFIDPEDSAAAQIRRLISFGCGPEWIIQNFKHTTCPTAADYQRLTTWAEQNRPEIVVIDGVAEVLAAEGLSEDKPDDFLKYCRERIKPFTNAGAAVLLCDHVVKSTEGRGRWARGTGAKLGRYDGISYAVELGQGYSPTKAGFVRLRIAKDRNGGIGVIGQEVAELHFMPQPSGKTAIKFKDSASKDAGRFVPTGIMEKISRRLETFPDSSLRDLRALGKAEYVSQAIEELVSLGHIQVLKGGPGRATEYRLISEYREHKEDHE